MRLKRGLMNVIAGIGSQLLILAFGMIVPRMMILTYGSEVNGFFSSISQLLSYLTLLEAGLGAAAIQALYKPIAEGDKLGISEILSATRNFYKKISFYYLIGVCLFTLIYPLIINSGINKIDMMIIIFLSGLSGVIDFYFQATIKQLMLAEGRAYVVTNIGLFVQVSTYIAKIIVIYLNKSIILIQALYLLINIVQVFIYKWYCKKKYSWVLKNAKPNYNALNQKHSFLIHQITSLIFMSTDTIVLTLESTLKIVSIYNVYNMIISALNLLCNTLNDGLAFILGLTYYENERDYALLHDTYNVYYSAFVTALMSICYVLFRPFLILYTNGMDENYILAYLPLMFCLIQILSALRMVSNNLIRIAGHMPQTVSRTIIEAVLNLGISVILTPKLGIYGVLLGTIIALAYRTNDIILYSDIKILKRNPIYSYKTVFINMMLFFIIVGINQKISLNMESYFVFFIGAIISSILIGSIYFFINSAFNKKEFNFLKEIVIGKIRDRQ